MLTKYQIESIRKRAESATEGPWRLYDEYCDTVETYSGKSVARVQSEGNRLSDMEFIANARQDIPALLEHIAALQGKIDLYESYAQECDYYAILNEMGDEDDNV
ncbi:hypothetical protein [Bacillus atrophaeus]|uniref:hypothetical protein n=1 Tax=Bacillus atrophaeus TaxID=1452 RepID=UPI002E1E433E|nr:hypothetical protein [Bacillus atrophaeus]